MTHFPRMSSGLTEKCQPISLMPLFLMDCMTHLREIAWHCEFLMHRKPSFLIYGLDNSFGGNSLALWVSDGSETLFVPWHHAIATGCICFFFFFISANDIWSFEESSLDWALYKPNYIFQRIYNKICNQKSGFNMS